jgi:hypothetical protein
MSRKKRSHSADADLLFDPAKLAEDAIQANLDPAVFELIDEGDIVWPRNWFEWVHGSRFLNVTPFAKQVEICTNLYGQFCPRCTDPQLSIPDDHWGNRILTLPLDMTVGDMQDRITFLEDGICPQCRVIKPELIEKNELNHYLNLAGCAGQRSSKTVIVGGLIGTYQLVRYLQLPSPSKFFGLMANQMIHGTFTAVTATQCYDTLWEAFKARLDNAPWFSQYHDFLKHEANRLGKDELYDVKDTYVWYGHKQLSFSYCGPDIRTIRGRTRILGSIDECGWFDVKAEGTSRSGGGIRLNAKETNQALVNSLRTIRAAAMKLRLQGCYDPPDAINADVSSPSSINDFIMRSLRSANQNRSVYGFHYATWEMNPNVPLESLRDQMGNPQDFERDYAAVPPLGANQFISAIGAVEKCVGPTPQTRLVSWQQKRLVDDFGDATVYLDVKPTVRDKSRPRLMAIDTGLTNNSFAVTLMSFDRDNRVPVVDVALECMPVRSETETLPVNFPMMFEHVFERLFNSFWVIMVVFDRWNSIDHMQRIRKDHKIESIQYSLKWADFQAIRARILDSAVTLPKLEVPIEDVRKDDRPFESIIENNPATHLALQTLTVREVGRKVIKPLNGTDDLFRCMCLGITFILDPKYTARFERYGGALAAGARVAGVVRLSRSTPIGKPEMGGTTGVGVHKRFGTGRLT